MNIHMQRQTTGMPYLLTDKQCIQQITRPRLGKKTQAPLFIKVYRVLVCYIRAFNPNLIRKACFNHRKGAAVVIVSILSNCPRLLKSVMNKNVVDSY